jgi:hypothetical protein
MTEFDDVIRLLRERRPEATELELDEIKQRVRRRAARTPGRVQSMKSRLAILSMLVLGMVFSTAGAGLAIGGLADSHGSAASVQYNHKPSGGGVAGQEENNQPAGTEQNQPTGTQNVQPTAQVEAGAGGGSTLPFTGFAAIPVLLGGIALLSVGLVLRRRGASDR